VRVFSSRKEQQQQQQQQQNLSVRARVVYRAFGLSLCLLCLLLKRETKGKRRCVYRSFSLQGVEEKNKPTTKTFSRERQKKRTSSLPSRVLFIAQSLGLSPLLCLLFIKRERKGKEYNAAPVLIP
jgi:hypothetical protein